MTRKSYLFAFLSLAFAMILILTSMLLPANAQDGGSTTDPDQKPYKYDDPAHVENGEADWTLTDSTFTSNYPDGFTFEAKASSSGGEVVSASIIYSHNPDWDEEDARMRGDVVNASGGLVRVIVAGRDADGIPPWVEVNYRWRLTDSAGTVYWSQWFVGGEYSDDTRTWQRQESEDILIFIQEGLPENAITMAFEAMEEARPIYEEAFGRTLSYKPRMMLFADLDTFREWRSFEYNAGGNYVIGQASAYWGAFVQVLTDSAEDFAFGTVLHEIGHLYQYDLYEMRAPSWWIEGNATYLEIKQQYDYENRVRTQAELGNLPRLFVEGGPSPAAGGPDGIGRWGYDVGYTFNKWFIDNYGWEAHRELIAKLAERDNVPPYEIEEFFISALEAVVGMDRDSIESEWRAWLGGSPEVPTLIPTPTIEMRFPPTVTPFGQ